ncbi:M20/M25/M40 family metallo-hydrolase [Sphingomonas sp.]|jgi:Zn-dependent M28 family amino/carboxypeptidase|uniref:M20/M25/M40 family metallo-hydrolase n=1 Tax=Sphingomonas sp. TaxID=28214 RepID=UPI002E0E8C16|nr:M20/M25/M40 family metallo-hydrolase [Sphingomonas sp.]HEV7289074.1 M20/M25/M40 family metallo-hydrolase [Sphingomonas sp.]
MLLRSFALAAALLTPAVASPDQLFEDVRILAADDMAGRLVGTPGSAKARAYLTGRMQAIGIEPYGAGYEQPFTAQHKDAALNGVNLVGRIRGTGTSDRVLVIGAHYDHFGVRGGKVLNGADDNASGVATLLSIAEDFARARPQHDVIFALWDAEEQGMYGARAFVETPPVPLRRIALNLNLDMMSRSDKGELWIAGAHHAPFLRARFERLAGTAPVTLKIGHDGPPWKGSDDWTAGSDHYAFHRKGIPFAYLGVEDYPDYHQPADDFETIPKAFFARSAATAVMAARLFDRELGAIAKEAGRGE